MRLITTLTLLLSLLFSFGNHLNGQVSSLYLPGPINYVEAGDLDVAGDQLTVEALIHYVGASVNVVSKHTGPADVNYLLRIGSFEITTTSGFANFGGVAAAGVNLVQGETYHLAATYNGQFLRYYVNGCLTGEMPWTGDMVQNDLITTIGARENCNCEQFTGYIDEVRVWNVARTQQEIADNMMNLPNPTITPGLLAYYKFDNNFTNVQGNAIYDGVIEGNPQFLPIPAPLPDEINLSTISSNPVCNAENNAVIEAHASGAYTPYEYSLDGVNYGPNGNFPNLTAGTYDVYARPQNNQNCVATQQIVITDPTPIIDNLNTTDVLCNGGNDGEAAVAPTGGHGPDYEIDWSSSTSTATTESGLAAGNYNVDITDTCVAAGIELVENGHFQSYYQGFTTDYGIGVPGPDIGGANIAVTPDANLFHSGFIGNGNQGAGNFVVVNGNTAPNQSVWCQTINVTPNTNYNFSMWLASLFAVSPGEVEVLFNGVSVGGIFTAPGTTGVWEEHEIFWNSGVSNSVDICIVGVNLDDVGNDFGIDDISLKECMSCTETFPFTINEPTALQLNANSIPENCSGSQDGEIEMIVNGGTGTYEYSIDTATTFQPNPIFTGLSGGAYAIIVRDQNNCLDTLEVTLNTLADLTFDINQIDVSCNLGSDGEIEIVNLQNAVNPFQYSIDNGVNTQVNNLFANLTAGTYDVWVEDDNGCGAVEQVVIDQPDALAVEFNVEDLSCFGANDGGVTVTNTVGGTPVYQYSVDGINFQGNTVFGGLSAVNYTLTVQDQNACLFDTTFVVTEPDQLVSGSQLTPISCFGGQDGIIEFQNTSGGTPTYSYSIDGGLNFSTNTVFTGLIAGTYNCVVEDGNGCQYSETVDLAQPQLLSPNAIAVDALCYGDCNGALVGEAQGGTPPYNFLWSGNGFDQQGAQQSDLCPGNYTLTVVDDNNCTATFPIVVNQPAEVIANFDTEGNEWTILDPTVNFINLSDEATNYDWSFGDGSSSGDVNSEHNYGENAGEYLVTLIAGNDFGCEDTVRRIITIANEILFYIPNTFTPDGNAFNETFKVEFFAGYEPEDYSFLIFNRWGQLIFEAESPDEEWDGTHEGMPVQDGTYIWKLEYRETITDERYIHTGHINIIR